MAQSYDVVVVGAGPGGYVAALRAGQLGLRTLCVDKNASPGGTCVNIGCIPSKALLVSSHHFDTAKNHLKTHGISCSGVKVDLEAMMSRKDQVVAGLVEGVKGLLKKNRVDYLAGQARLTSPTTLEVTEGDRKAEVSASHIIIATGSEPIALPFLPFDEKRVISSTGALSLDRIPRKMIVIGAGAIGVELASVYRRLGTEITVVEMLPNICPAMDPAISRALQQSLTRQGFEFHLGAQVLSGTVGKEGVALKVKSSEGDKELKADLVLVAVGRRPYTAGLGLKEIGVVLTAKGFVAVDGQFRTSIPSIYAIGDVIEGVMLAHKASEEGVAVAELIAGHHAKVNYMAVPNVIYTHPEVAAVGLTEPEAKAAGLDVITGTFPMRATPRARCAGESDGLVKVIGEKRSGRLLGMHIMASAASEMIAEGVIAMEHKATIQDLASACHAHPSLTEAIKEACLNALGRALHI